MNTSCCTNPIRINTLLIKNRIVFPAMCTKYAAPDGGVAALYRLPDAQGCVGLIRPVSRHFCAACNRLRLTADGKLKPCLHSGQELSIRGLDDEAMRAQFLRAIRKKPAQHAPLDLAHQSEAGRSMNEIGG